MQAVRDESVHTVNAAAVVLAAAARSSTGLGRHHHLQLQDHAAAAATKRRWWSWLTKANLACFRPHGHPRRIAAADTSPQPADAHATSAAYVHHAPPVHPVFAFVAPPSSPASSLFASESPSPVLLLDTAGTSPSMFAVGPYARGPQQLVSPPVLYSTLTTEPSTAPRTPPVITTNPSSPEVPFARFLGSSLSSSSMAVDGEAGSLFQEYQLQPGSPIPLVLPPGSSSPTPQLFRKLHRRTEGSLLDGHIPMAIGVFDLDVPDTGRDQGHGGAERDDGDEEVPKSGEFVFGSADGGGAAPAEDMDGEARKNWQFFPMVEQGMI